MNEAGLGVRGLGHAHAVYLVGILVIHAAAGVVHLRVRSLASVGRLHLLRIVGRHVGNVASLSILTVDLGVELLLVAVNHVVGVGIELRKALPTVAESRNEDKGCYEEKIIQQRQIGNECRGQRTK